VGGSKGEFFEWHELQFKDLKKYIQRIKRVDVVLMFF
jgi:hypothetical protein